MAKRKVKAMTEAELAEIEADRIAASDRTGIYAHSDSAGQNAEQFAVDDDELAYEQQAAREAKEEEELDAISDGIDRIHAELDEKEAIEGRLEELEEMEEALEDKVPNSVVKDKFKVKYIENARALGIPGKAAKRSNWDWLSQRIAAACLDEKHSIRISDFVALLDANGVDSSRWTNRNRGWEGRFRMTGRVALQKKVADAGVLHTPDGSEWLAPAEWCERYKTKAK
jgi:hypothetical protein